MWTGLVIGAVLASTFVSTTTTTTTTTATANNAESGAQSAREPLTVRGGLRRRICGGGAATEQRRGIGGALVEQISNRSLRFRRWLWGRRRLGCDCGDPLRSRLLFLGAGVKTAAGTRNSASFRFRFRSIDIDDDHFNVRGRAEGHRKRRTTAA